jgi:hypothetical protein
MTVYRISIEWSEPVKGRTSSLGPVLEDVPYKDVCDAVEVMWKTLNNLVPKALSVKTIAIMGPYRMVDVYDGEWASEAPIEEDAR